MQRLMSLGIMGVEICFSQKFIGFYGGDHNRSCMFDGKCWWRVLGSPCFLIEIYHLQHSVFSLKDINYKWSE